MNGGHYGITVAVCPEKITGYSGTQWTTSGTYIARFPRLHQALRPDHLLGEGKWSWCPRMNERHVAEEPDVVVSGGGPGGCTLTSLVATRGHRVVLLEKPDVDAGSTNMMTVGWAGHARRSWRWQGGHLGAPGWATSPGSAKSSW
jgi:hypothetical protein